jgi:hypothetical protein
MAFAEAFAGAVDAEVAELGAEPEVVPVVAPLAAASLCAAAVVEPADPLLEEHPLSSPTVRTHAAAMNLDPR